MQEKLQAPDCRWDLVVCDEAHKMSATFFGGEIKYTKRYRLGQLLSTLTRHFLLMTATPHNGKEEDFQLFMALLDGDRFEGRFRDGVHVADVSDLMRRMVKESLLKFDGTPLFPERIAYTVPYKLSDAEAQLYKEVTDYVREEFNRAEALAERQARRHRRLRAHHPAAAAGLLARGDLPVAAPPPRAAGEAGCASWSCSSAAARSRRHRAPTCRRSTPRMSRTSRTRPDNEVEAAEEEILDQATAARTIAELKAEIETLQAPGGAGARRSAAAARTRKWRELASLLGEIFTPAAIADRVAEADGALRRRPDPAARRRRRARSSSSSPSTATR